MKRFCRWASPHEEILSLGPLLMTRFSLRGPSPWENFVFGASPREEFCFGDLS